MGSFCCSGKPRVDLLYPGDGEVAVLMSLGEYNQDSLIQIRDIQLLLARADVTAVSRPSRMSSSRSWLWVTPQESNPDHTPEWWPPAQGALFTSS
jgi:hypothetical protein